MDKFGQVWISLDSFRYVVNVLLGLEKFIFVLGHMFVLFVRSLVWIHFSKLFKLFIN